MRARAAKPPRSKYLDYETLLVGGCQKEIGVASGRQRSADEKNPSELSIPEVFRATSTTAAKREKQRGNPRRSEGGYSSSRGCGGANLPMSLSYFLTS